MIDVLDHGFVKLVDIMGRDITVVNAARVSFGKSVACLDDKDIKLIHYLADHQHWSPFRHVQFQFHCKVPEFVARQWYKHVVGIAYTEGATVDHAWNEISQRYVDASSFDFYVPDGFRKQAENNKQCSIDELLIDDRLNYLFAATMDDCRELYEKLIKAGVAKEQARAVLPLSVYTEFYWTASLQAVVNFIKLRKHPGAQWEIQQYADAIEELIKPWVPVSYEALMNS